MATFPGSPPNPLGFKAELNLAGTWTDITQFVMLRDYVNITNMGRTDESGNITPSQLTLTLKNDGRFTPKNTSGAYYPNIVRNCQIRISVNATSKTGVAYNQFRFFGEISSWPPGYDISQRDTYVQITASGIWRRISQSSVPIGSCYWRYVNLLTGLSVPAAYWSMEDGSSGTANPGFVLSEGTGTNIVPTGTPSYAADGSSFPGSNAIPTMNGARLAANVSSAATPTNNVMRFALSVPPANDSSFSQFTVNTVATMLATSATVKRVDVTLNSTGQLAINGYTSTAGGTPTFTGTITTKVAGVPVLVSVEITPSGSSIAWAMKIIKPGAGSVLDSVSGTRASSTITAVTQIQLNNQGRLQDTAVGQLGIWYTVPSLTTAASNIGGQAGELAADRITRLCSESNIPLTVIGSGGAAMGPQVSDTMANVLQSIEDTDGGLLYETRDQFGLGYRTLASMQNQAAAATISYTSGALGAPLTPTYDDQLIHNQYTVTNTPTGYLVTAQLNSGALSIAPPPNGVGQGYAASKSINANSNTQANTIAQQLLTQGTVDDVRYPTVVINFLRTAAAAFFSSVPSMRIGDFFQISNLPAFLGGGTTKQLMWGYSEQIGGNPEGWTITINAVPELPFETSFSPGSLTVLQGAAGGVPQGSAVGSTVNGSQVGPGAISGGQAAVALSARSVGGVTQFVSAATPYKWSFAVTGTPADNSYFTCTSVQSLAISVGDTFSNTGGLGSPFTVTSIDQAGSGLVNVHFTPDATGVMSSGTVQGSANGDTWVNTSAGNQVNTWQNGVWTPIQFGPTATGNQGGIINLNPYFNAGDPAGWFGFNGTFSVTGSPPSGAPYPFAGVYVNNGVSTGFANEPGIPVTPGQQYQLSAWIRSTTGSVRLGFEWDNSSGSFISDTVQNFTIAANTWTLLSTVQTAPALAATCKAHWGTQTADGSTIHAEAVCVIPQIPGALIQASSITAAQIAANTITASQIAAGTIIAGIVDGTTIMGATLIADGSSGEILVYSGTPALGNLIGSWSGASGTDAQGNAYSGNLEVHSGGLVLDNQASAPAGVSGASTFYSSVLGRPRYISSVGDDSVIERSIVSQTNVNMTTQTAATAMSQQLTIQSGEANVGSEFDIEVIGTITAPTGGTGFSSGAAGIAYTMQLMIDGTTIGGAFTLGGVFLVQGSTFSFNVAFRLSVEATGAGGTCTMSSYGTCTEQGVNIGNLNAGGVGRSQPISSVGTGKPIDTTTSHAIKVFGFWGSTLLTGHSAKTVRSKMARRM